MPHIHDKIDFTVEVFIVYQDKVLLRIHDKLKIWLSVGGHIELDEDPNQAAIREVKEEVGLDISLKNPNNFTKNDISFKELMVPKFLNRHKVDKTHEHITFVYFVKATSDKISENMEAEKSEEIRWFTKKDLETEPNLRENIRFYALKALEEFIS